MRKRSKNFISIFKTINNGSKPMLHLLNLTNPFSSTLFSSHKPSKTHQPITLKMSSWTCSKCTFLNPPFQKSNCQMCHTPQIQTQSPLQSSLSNFKWDCSACTFKNPFKSSVCEICGTRNSVSMRSRLEIDEDDIRETGSSVGSVFLPLLRACGDKVKESVEKSSLGNGKYGSSNEGGFTGLRACSNKRKDREEDVGLDNGGEVVEIQSLGETPMGSDCKTWKILTYNIWFREEIQMHKRMNAIGYLIQLHSPDVMCFQEVTPNLYGIFKKSSWWKGYHCSISDEKAFPGPYFCMQLCKLPVKSYFSRPFNNSIMGRELSVAETVVQPGMELVVATSHLESPNIGPPTWDQTFSKERVLQAKEAVNFLDKNRNVIFCGDMNWDDKKDGSFPLSNGWLDAWTALRPGEVGFTYDTKSNMMISGYKTLQKRLDRFLCKLRDFKICEIKMIGTDSIPGVTHIMEKKVKGQVKELTLPVLPSDHYGLLLTISAKDSDST